MNFKIGSLMLSLGALRAMAQIVRCPSRFDTFCIPLVSVPPTYYEETVLEQLTTAAQEVLATGVTTELIEGSETIQLVDVDTDLASNSDGESPFESVSTVVFTDIVPIEDGELTFSDPNADAVVGVFVQDIDQNLSLVDCITATKTRFVKYEYFGRTCRAKVDESVLDACKFSTTDQQITIVGQDGGAESEAVAVVDTDGSIATVFVAAESTGLFTLNAINTATFESVEDENGDPEYQFTQSTSFVNQVQEGDVIENETEILNTATEDTATGAVSISGKATSSETTTTTTMVDP